MKELCSSVSITKDLAGFFILFSLAFLFSGSVYAHSVPLEYEMTVDFEVDKSILIGEADFNLPAGHGMKLLVSGLDDLRVKVGGSSLEKDPDKEGIMTIPTEENKRLVSLSWKKKAGEEGSSLIGPEGITLQGTWYPRPASEADYSLKALIPSGFAAVSEADRIETEQKDGQKQVTFHFPHPLSYLHFIAGPYEVVEEEFSDGKVLASYFFEEDKDLAASYRKKARNYLERYIGLFGEYPYGRFSIVENRRPTGFAMPTFTLLGQQVVRLPFILDTSLGHEVLHSWLGNAVQAVPEQGNWVEGLSTYLADQAYAADKGEGADFRKSQLVKYQNHVDGNNTLTVKDFTNPGGHNVADQAKRAVGYNKCSMIFHMLRNRVGEDDFRKSLRRFYENNKYGRAGWQEIEETFSEVSGMDLSVFFAQWLNRSDVPVLEISNLDFQEDGGDLHLSFDIAQKNSKPYNLIIPVRVHTESGTVNKKVKMESDRVSVSLELPDYPTRLVVDPGYDLMRPLAEDELPPVWSAFLGAGDKLAVIEEGKEELYAPMIEMVERLGGRVVKDENLDEKEMEGSSLLFLGEDSGACRSIFGKVDLADKGFSLEVRKNPLNLDEVAVINQASDRREVEAVAEKLRHYGKYGILHFQEGRNLKKEIPGSSRGIVRNLDKTPGGIALSEHQDFGDIMEKMAESRVIYVGETHVRFADHQLQMRVIRALYQRHPEMAIGMEMFPAGVQETLDKYIRGEIDERQFLKEVDYFQNWGYDYRFYQNIMQFARKHDIPVLGLNLDRNIVNTTFRQGGISALDEEVKKNLPASMDLSMEGYRERLGDVFKQHQGPHFNNGGMSGFVQAQALWDETMAEKVADYLRENPGSKMVVLAGGGHVNKKTGIPPRVSRRIEVAQSVALNTGGEEKLSDDEADYLFFTPAFDVEKSPMLGVKLKSGEEGLTVSGFTHGRSPARRDGLKKKDVILALDDQEVNNVEDIKIVLLYKEKGDTVRVKVKRDSFLLFPDSEKEIEVRL
ncbi:MAG: ChaN family lipoprotein [Desulfurivibrionaceae bacterium]